jgi:sodium/potassium/calcium exchanger 6
MSSIWLFAVGLEIAGVLKVFGRAFAVPSEVLGLSIIAWSNTVSDIVTAITFSREGWPDTAFSAAMGSSIMNLLVGLGLALLVYGVRYGPAHIPPTNLLLATFGFLGTCVIVLSIAVPVFGFNLNRKLSAILLVLYGAYAVTAVCLQAGLFPFLNS